MRPICYFLSLYFLYYNDIICNGTYYISYIDNISSLIWMLIKLYSLSLGEWRTWKSHWMTLGRNCSRTCTRMSFSSRRMSSSRRPAWVSHKWQVSFLFLIIYTLAFVYSCRRNFQTSSTRFTDKVAAHRVPMCAERHAGQDSDYPGAWHPCTHTGGFRAQEGVGVTEWSQHCSRE